MGIETEPQMGTDHDRHPTRNAVIQSSTSSSANSLQDCYCLKQRYEEDPVIFQTAETFCVQHVRGEIKIYSPPSRFS